MTQTIKYLAITLFFVFGALSLTQSHNNTLKNNNLDLINLKIKVDGGFAKFSVVDDH